MDSFDAQQTATLCGLSAEQQVLCEKYLDILLAYNEKVNLTSITSKEDAVVKHLEDSLAALPYLPPSATLIDIGSGGGCPAIPLKIARPELKLTMTDSVGKKTAFLEYAVRELGLSDTNVLTARAEELARGALRESFDVATARAVAALPELIELAAPLIKPGGIFLAYKGSKDEEAQAANAAQKLCLRLKQRVDYTLGGFPRILLIYEKTASVLDRYPRTYAKIQKKPL